ncbi:META domain-containing protein [Tessaracoccus lacteus]|uniref:META domain-containing protein n=1 Tax=Tessaracoccus lacteus TaxID=3041766 RepID=A0ABY8PU99_9ACTN|nr:META domain-containing protein [Tessaracoccus sp. T21]WGT46015.1 META domain-containing protein [Tessaracoccus sp. T21]
MAKALWTTAVVAMSLLLASCASATPAAPPSSGDLVGVTWLLENLAGEAPVDGSPVTVHFADDGALFGSGGCNRFSGTYEIDGGTLTVGDALPSTMMACADDVMALESAFFTALTSARGFAVEDETLTLNDESGAALGTLAAQSQDLADTTWNITAYNDGVSAVVSVLEGAEANLTFADDGTISGTGGCNRVLGSYTAGDGTISFGILASTQMFCGADGVMDQEAAVIAALESAATFSIEGDMLEMRTADDAIAVQLTRA